MTQFSDNLLYGSQNDSAHWPLKQKYLWSNRENKATIKTSQSCRYSFFCCGRKTAHNLVVFHIRITKLYLYKDTPPSNCPKKKQDLKTEQRQFSRSYKNTRNQDTRRRIFFVCFCSWTNRRPVSAQKQGSRQETRRFVVIRVYRGLIRLKHSSLLRYWSKLLQRQW